MSRIGFFDCDSGSSPPSEGYISYYGNQTISFFKEGVVNVSFDDFKIKIVGELWIPLKSGRVRVLDREVAFTSSSLSQVVILNTDTGVVTTRLGSSSFAVANNEAILGGLNTVSKDVWGFPNVYIDGVPTSGSSPSVPTPDAVRESSIALTLYPEGGLRFNFLKDEIEVSSQIWIPAADGRITINPQVFPLDPNRNIFTSLRTLVLLNKATLKFVFTQESSGYQLPDNHLLIGAFHEKSRELWGFDKAYIDDKPVVKEKTVAFAWDTETFDNVNVTDMVGYGTPDISLSTIDTNTVYGWYDALVTAHPEYVTKVNLGKDASGTIDVFEYIFKPDVFALDGGVAAEIPRVLIQALHNERFNFIYTFIMMREICNSWQNNDTLEGLRFGSEIRIIPCLNAWGLDNVSRTNSNGVDINRNYPYGFVLNETSPTHNSGPSPLSEAETIISYSELLEFKPHVFIDCHSFGDYVGDGRSLWLTSVKESNRIVCNNTAVRSYVDYKKRYNWLPDYNDFVRMADAGIVSGQAASTGAYLGIEGGTVEISHNLKGETQAEVQGSTEAVNYAVDTLLYFVKQCIKQSI